MRRVSNGWHLLAYVFLQPPPPVESQHKPQLQGPESSSEVDLPVLLGGMREVVGWGGEGLLTIICYDPLISRPEHSMFHIRGSEQR